MTELKYENIEARKEEIKETKPSPSFVQFSFYFLVSLLR